MSARERAQLDNSCNLIGSESGGVFPTDTLTLGGSVVLINFSERIGHFPYLALSRLKVGLNLKPHQVLNIFQTITRSTFYKKLKTEDYVKILVHPITAL